MAVWYFSFVIWTFWRQLRKGSVRVGCTTKVRFGEVVLDATEILMMCYLVTSCIRLPTSKIVFSLTYSYMCVSCCLYKTSFIKFRILLRWSRRAHPHISWLCTSLEIYKAQMVSKRAEKPHTTVGTWKTQDPVWSPIDKPVTTKSVVGSVTTGE